MLKTPATIAAAIAIHDRKAMRCLRLPVGGAAAAAFAASVEAP
jgi:hypothetical protein